MPKSAGTASSACEREHRTHSNPANRQTQQQLQTQKMGQKQLWSQHHVQQQLQRLHRRHHQQTVMQQRKRLPRCQKSSSGTTSPGMTSLLPMWCAPLVRTIDRWSSGSASQRFCFVARVHY